VKDEDTCSGEQGNFLLVLCGKKRVQKGCVSKAGLFGWSLLVFFSNMRFETDQEIVRFGGLKERFIQ